VAVLGYGKARGGSPAMGLFHFCTGSGKAITLFSLILMVFYLPTSSLSIEASLGF